VYRNENSIPRCIDFRPYPPLPPEHPHTKSEGRGKPVLEVDQFFCPGALSPFRFLLFTHHDAGMWWAAVSMTYSKQSTGTGCLRQPAGSIFTLLVIRSFILITYLVTRDLKSSQVFRDVTPRRLVNTLPGAYCFHLEHQEETLKMKAPQCRGLKFHQTLNLESLMFSSSFFWSRSTWICTEVTQFG